MDLHRTTGVRLDLVADAAEVEAERAAIRRRMEENPHQLRFAVADAWLIDRSPQDCEDA